MKEHIESFVLNIQRRITGNLPESVVADLTALVTAFASTVTSSVKGHCHPLTESEINTLRESFRSIIAKE